MLVNFILTILACVSVYCYSGERGIAKYYNPEIFERVWNEETSKKIDPCRECVGYAALVEPELGTKVWVLKDDGLTDQAIGPLYVIDSGQAEHRAMQHAYGLVIDVDYYTAMKLGMAGPIEVAIYRNKKPFRKGGPSEE